MENCTEVGVDRELSWPTLRCYERIARRIKLCAEIKGGSLIVQPGCLHLPEGSVTETRVEGAVRWGRDLLLFICKVEPVCELNTGVRLHLLTETHAHTKSTVQ
jgi:hypothetical protein